MSNRIGRGLGVNVEMLLSLLRLARLFETRFHGRSASHHWQCFNANFHLPTDESPDACKSA